MRVLSFFYAPWSIGKRFMNRRLTLQYVCADTSVCVCDKISNLPAKPIKSFSETFRRLFYHLYFLVFNIEGLPEKWHDVTMNCLPLNWRRIPYCFHATSNMNSSLCISLSFFIRQTYFSWQKQKKAIVLQNKQLTTNVICWIIPIFGMLQIATDIFRKRLALFHNGELRQLTSVLEYWGALSLWCVICINHIIPEVWVVFSYPYARQSKAYH